MERICKAELKTTAKILQHCSSAVRTVLCGCLLYASSLELEIIGVSMTVLLNKDQGIDAWQQTLTILSKNNCKLPCTASLGEMGNR